MSQTHRERRQIYVEKCEAVQRTQDVRLHFIQFLCGIFRTLLSRANFICRREQSVCHVVSTWHEDCVLLIKILCGGIPVSVISLMALFFYWVLFYGAF